MSSTVPPRDLRAWRPLLTGLLADEARAAVIEIARALRSPSENSFAWDKHSLVKGAAGHAMLFWYLADCELVEDAAETAERFEQRARFLITREPAMLSLFYGLTGVGAAAICSPRNASRPYAEKLCRTIDHVLLQTLRKGPWEGQFDLFWGLVGLGVYAGLRAAEPASREILERIVEQLEGCAEAVPGGIAWRTRPERVPSPLREMFPQGQFDLGLSNGTPGVIALLSHCVHLGVDPARARRLVTQAVPWLRSQQLRDPAPLRYTSRVVPGEPLGEGGVGWCHGDAGVAAALLAAGRLLEVPEWEQEAIDLARNAANGPPPRDGVEDTCLCHGTAGVGHILNRMALQTGDRSLEDAARRWLERTLATLPSGRVMAAFPSKDPPTADRRTNDGVLVGAAGVALALAAAIGAAPPDWDRLFLLSWPEPGHRETTTRRTTT